MKKRVGSSIHGSQQTLERPSDRRTNKQITNKQASVHLMVTDATETQMGSSDGLQSYGSMFLRVVVLGYQYLSSQQVIPTLGCFRTAARTTDHGLTERSRANWAALFVPDPNKLFLTVDLHELHMQQSRSIMNALEQLSGQDM